MVETGSEPIYEQGEFGTGPKPIPETGDAKPPLVFEEDVDDSCDRVAHFEKDEGVEIPIWQSNPQPLKYPKLVRGRRRNI